jgi:hypothetical protein
MAMQRGTIREAKQNVSDEPNGALPMDTRAITPLGFLTLTDLKPKG